MKRDDIMALRHLLGTWTLVARTVFVNDEQGLARWCRETRDAFTLGSGGHDPYYSPYGVIRWTDDELCSVMCVIKDRNMAFTARTRARRIRRVLHARHARFQAEETAAKKKVQIKGRSMDRSVYYDEYSTM